MNGLLAEIVKDRDINFTKVVQEHTDNDNNINLEKLAQELEDIYFAKLDDVNSGSIISRRILYKWFISQAIRI